MQCFSRGQSGMEYLMTYGWALILIVSVASVIFFIFSSSGNNTTFSTSNSLQIVVKGNGLDALLLANSSAKTINITGISFFGDIGATSGYSINNRTAFPITVNPGQDISLTGISILNNCSNGATVILNYTDNYNNQREIKISCNNGGKMPIAWFKLDEGQDDTTSNSVGTGPVGNLHPSGSGPSWQSSCAIGNCLFFDGQNDAIYFGDVFDAGNSDWSVSVWFNPAAANSGMLYNKEDLFEARVTGSTVEYAWQPNWNWVNSSFPILTGQWHHLVITYDHSKQIVYRNGAKVFERNQTGNIGTNSESFRLGARNCCGGENFNGKIDEFRIYDKTLTQFEACSLCRETASTAGITCNC